MDFVLLGYGPTGYADELLVGLGVTLALGILSFAIALVLGTLLSVSACAKGRAARLPWKVYRSVIMSLPSLLVVFLIYFNLPLFLEMLLGIEVSVEPFAAGAAALSLVYAAYVCEVIQGALKNVPAGQYEACRALALPSFQAWRKIIAPQAFRIALAGLGNIWMVLIKDTALVSLVGLTDIVRQATIAANSTQQPFLFYFAALLTFIAIAGLSHLGMQWLERHLQAPTARTRSK